MLQGKQHAKKHAMTSTGDHSAGTHKVFYSDSSGNILELALAAAGRALFANGTSSAPSFELVPANTGWIDANETWTYQSVDDPTGVIKVTGVDVTGKYSEDMKIKFTNGGNTIFGGITKVALSGSDTHITFLHEIDPADSLAKNLLANSAITANYYSTARAPYAFPLLPSKWTVYYTTTSDGIQATPTQNVWYNLGTATLSVPIGNFELEYYVNGYAQESSSATALCSVTMSTANNSESDTDLTATVAQTVTVAHTNNVPIATLTRKKYVNLASKTSYYLNARTNQSAQEDLRFRNSQGALLMRATWTGL